MQSLDALLASLFDVQELRRFIGHHYPELQDEIAFSAAMSLVAFDVAEKLQKRGLADDVLRERLIKARSHRRSDIESSRAFASGGAEPTQIAPAVSPAGELTRKESVADRKDTATPGDRSELFTPTIGILTALPKECAAVRLMLENEVRWRAGGEGGGKAYYLGDIPAEGGGRHQVAVALLPDMGNNSAAIRATLLLQHFPSVRHILMCGIAGGVPKPGVPEHDVRLGDIVVSNRYGVIQYDFIKEGPEGAREHRYSPRPPGAELLEAVGHLLVEEEVGARPWNAFLARGAKMKNSARPADNLDTRGQTIDYPEDRERTPSFPRVFHAVVAAANVLLKNPEYRDYLGTAFGVKAVEMEGSGIADATWTDGAGYLVVRGICDYCDANKGDLWQGAAAVAAAAYVRALIASMPASAASRTPGPQYGKRGDVGIPEATISQQDIRRHVLSEELHVAYANRRELLMAGSDTAAIEKRILELRRALRDGPSLQSGEFLDDGRYLLMEVVGRGGFGVVWKAWDEQTGRLVAIKVLHGQWSHDRSKLDRFFSGARQMIQLRHPAIVAVLHEGVEDSGFHFFVMEYIPGGDLHAVVLSGRLDKQAALKAVAQVGGALAYAHAQALIHRDVKPQNILIDERGEGHLTDFDLVHALNTTLGTRTGAVMGTFLYAAPELLGDASSSNACADVYGLAMTAVFCLYGKSLPAEALYNTSAFLERLDISDEAREVLQGCLHKDHQQRSSDVRILTELIQDIIVDISATKLSSSSVHFKKASPYFNKHGSRSTLTLETKTMRKNLSMLQEKYLSSQDGFDLWEHVAILHHELGEEREAMLCWARALWDVNASPRHMTRQRQEIARRWSSKLPSSAYSYTSDTDLAREAISFFFGNDLYTDEFQNWHSSSLDIRTRWMIRQHGKSFYEISRLQKDTMTFVQKGLVLWRDLPGFLRTSASPKDRFILSDSLSEICESLCHQIPTSAPVSWTRLYLRLMISWAQAHLGFDQKVTDVLGEAESARSGDPVHEVIISLFRDSILTVRSGLERPHSQPIRDVLAALERFDRYKVDRLRNQSAILGQGTALTAFASFVRDEVDPLPAIPKDQLLPTIARWLQELSPEEPVPGLLRVLNAVVAVAETEAFRVLNDVIDRSSTLGPSDRVEVLVEALSVAAALRRPDSAEAALEPLATGLAELARQDPARIVAPAISMARSLARCGLAEPARRALNTLHEAVPRENWSLRLQLRAALAQVGGEVADAIHTAFEVLGSPLSAKQRLEVVGATAELATPLPAAEAVAVWSQLVQHAAIEDAYSTKTHFALSFLFAAECIVVAHVHPNRVRRPELWQQIELDLRQVIERINRGESYLGLMEDTPE